MRGCAVRTMRVPLGDAGRAKQAQAPRGSARNRRVAADGGRVVLGPIGAAGCSGGRGRADAGSAPMSPSRRLGSRVGSPDRRWDGGWPSRPAMGAVDGAEGGCRWSSVRWATSPRGRWIRAGGQPVWPWGGRVMADGGALVTDLAKRTQRLRGPPACDSARSGQRWARRRVPGRSGAATTCVTAVQRRSVSGLPRATRCAARSGRSRLGRRRTTVHGYRRGATARVWRRLEVEDARRALEVLHRVACGPVHVDGVPGRMGRARDGMPVPGEHATAVQDVAITRLAAIEEEWHEDGTVVETHRAPGHVALDAPDLVAGASVPPTCTRSAGWPSPSASSPHDVGEGGGGGRDRGRDRWPVGPPRGHGRRWSRRVSRGRRGRGARRGATRGGRGRRGRTRPVPSRRHRRAAAAAMSTDPGADQSRPPAPASETCT